MATNFLDALVEDVELKEEEVVQHESASAAAPEDEPKSDAIAVNVSNVVCHFLTRCHLNLRTICRKMWNVEHVPQRNQVMMQLRKPFCYVHIRPSGNVTCFGFRNDDDAYTGARRVARLIARAGFPVQFVDFRIVNVMANVQLPFRVDLDRLHVLINATSPAQQAIDEPDVDFSLVRSYIYEPELHPAATLKIAPDHESKREVTFQSFSSGAVSILAPNCAAIFATLSICVPLLASCQFDASRARSHVERDTNVAGRSFVPVCRALLDHNYARPIRLLTPLGASSAAPSNARIVQANVIRQPAFDNKRIRVQRTHDALGLDSDIF